MTPRRLPEGFLLGCATAAHQVEGGIDNDWSRWVADHPEAINGGGDAVIAIDQYRRYREDLEQLGAMHHNAHRFSVEWARVEPEPGRFDLDALAHYADVVRTWFYNDDILAWYADFNRVLQLPEVKDKLAAQGAEPIAMTPEQFAGYLRAEIVKWAKAIKDSGAKPD